ncbi:Fanconi anemia group C protein [Genypterus blacodes]|uniref:Fanconi anemia group C protein n=1 Tax=Genypterus blacodes TaxID=154954 RepID=UPI003F7779DF
MSQLQPPTQAQQGAEPLLSVQEMQFWLGKAVAWGQVESPDAQKDTCLHMSRLKDFLQLLLTHISNMCSTSLAIERLPLLGQLLGRLCWNPYVTADATSRGLLLESVWKLHSEHPRTAVERKANQWIQKVLRLLITEEDNPAAVALVKHVGGSSNQYHLKVLKKMVALLSAKIGKGCDSPSDVNQRCSCDSVLAASEVCISLVSCPEAAPLFAALLQRPATCGKAVLSEDFLDALSSAYTSKCLDLEEQAVVSLWYHSLSSLQGAVLSLLECVLTNTGAAPPSEQLLAESLLPKACAQHCSIFLVVNDIFRSILRQAEGCESIRSLIQTFSSCFLREATLLQTQEHVSLKAFFPRAPQALLLPLLTQPSEMPQESRRRHLIWLSGSLRRLTEEEEEGDEDGSSSRQQEVFESWFLLVQCAHWVHAALQLLVMAAPEDCEPLLWLLTFYHHPTNRGHCRASQLVRAREALSHLQGLFTAATHPLPVSRLQSLVELLSPDPQQPSVLIISLLVNFAIFSQLPQSGSTELLQKVVEQCGCVAEAASVLSSVELRLNGGSSLSGDANRVQLRIKALQSMLTLIHTEPC